MSAPRPATLSLDELSLDPSNLSRSAVDAIRMAFGIGGGIALVLGVVLLAWPAKSLAVIAIIIGVNFVAAAMVRLAMAIFVTGLGGGLRVLNVVVGILLLILGIVAIKNSVATGAILAILVVVVIGLGWILEGIITLVESGRAQSRGWAIVFGVVSVLAGVAVLTVPELSAMALVTLSGILLAIVGIAGIVRAITFGRGAPRAR